MNKNSKLSQIAYLFKPWIVRRPNGGCQVLFPLSELDNLVIKMAGIITGKRYCTCPEYKHNIATCTCRCGGEKRPE